MSSHEVDFEKIAAEYSTIQKLLEFMTVARTSISEHGLLTRLDDLLYSYSLDAVRRHVEKHGFWVLMRHLRREDYDTLIIIASHRDLDMCNFLASSLINDTTRFFDNPTALYLHDNLSRVLSEYPDYVDEKRYLARVVSKFVHIPGYPFKSILQSTIWSISTIDSEILHILQSELSKPLKVASLHDFIASISTRSNFRSILEVCMVDPVFSKSYEDWSILRQGGIVACIQEDYTSMNS